MPEAPAEMSRSPAPRLHALDGARAIAATLVVLGHLGGFNAAQHLAESGHRLAASLLGGVVAGGVDLFFLLSGVVLARPYLRSQRPMNVTHYFSRRVTRLVPPYLVAWLVAGLSIYLASSLPTWWTVTAHLPIFNLRDWLQQIAIIYWGERRYNFAWWSLSTEVSFYLVFPLLIELFRGVSRSPTRVTAIFLLSVLVSQLAFVHPMISVSIFNDLLAFASCFCGGMLLAAVDFTPRTRRRLALAGAAWVVCSVYVSTLNRHVGWGFLAFALVSSASEYRTAIEKVLSRPLFVWVGERSYSIFLTHFAVIVFVCHGVSTLTASKDIAYFLATRLLAIPSILFTAMLLFHFVERRFARNLVTANAFWPWSASFPESSTAAYAGAV